MNRRKLLLNAGKATLAIPLVVLVRQAAHATDLPELELTDSTGQALGYIRESEVDDQTCANCQLYTGVEGEDLGPCALFPGKSVRAAGWCKSWIQKVS